MRLCFDRATSCGVPAVTMRPPLSPAPGPISSTQSLCATTLHVVLYDDDGISSTLTKPFSCAINFWTLRETGQARGRLVEDVQRVAALRSLQLGR